MDTATAQALVKDLDRDALLQVRNAADVRINRLAWELQSAEAHDGTMGTYGTRWRIAPHIVMVEGCPKCAGRAPFRSDRDRMKDAFKALRKSGLKARFGLSDSEDDEGVAVYVRASHIRESRYDQGPFGQYDLLRPA